MQKIRPFQRRVFMLCLVARGNMECAVRLVFQMAFMADHLCKAEPDSNKQRILTTV